MTVEWSPQFEADYLRLPEPIKRKVRKALYLFERHPSHPSLQIEKIDRTREIWSGRVDRANRFTFRWQPGGVLLRRVGPHDRAYRHP